MKLLCSRSMRAVSSREERLMLAMPPASQVILNWWLEACSSSLTSASFLMSFTLCILMEGSARHITTWVFTSFNSLLQDYLLHEMPSMPCFKLPHTSHRHTHGPPLYFISATPSSAPFSLFIYCLPSTRLYTSRSLIFSSPP